ncbi:hypothetical protein Clacol_009178 [Clathrus columnatus]|uniref:Required for respiratory growth protein 9, mitochondrial n=1 Tax=Clathrus columnatus TaxID=1419009 RepID=A0AAV5AQE6_9AGAM|nr:hypothetical protein Clacol_009178 [Clathrus columnatus]
MYSLNFIRPLSTKIPRPKNWKISRVHIPKPLVLTQIQHHERPSPTVSSRPSPQETPTEFVKHRQTMKKNFPEGWSPPKKLTRDAMDSLRTLHQISPDVYTTPILAEKFRISPEAVRRILRSKWFPSGERLEQIRAKETTRRVERRKQRVNKEWTEVAETGLVDYSEPFKRLLFGAYVDAT